jgi:peptidoglycan/xylan/chitin deacetylase (PgdA/CDA1 family)
VKLPLLKTAERVYKRRIARLFCKRTHRIQLDTPLISFSFDDFPRSALQAGGSILKTYGLSGTFYVSLGCLGQDSPSGRLCSADDVIKAVKDGHELGCHTFSHCHSWDTKSAVYEHSIIENEIALGRIVPGVRFESFSYPISRPRPSVKRAASRHFAGCREGGQQPNVGTVDLHQIGAYFLEKSGKDIQEVKKVIDLNHKRRGWLVFATHDVADAHSPYGCTPEFFREVTEYAVQCGAQVLPVGRALELLGAKTPSANGRDAECASHAALPSGLSGR